VSARLASPRAVETIVGPLPRGAAWEALVARDTPVLFKGAASHWPLVAAGKRSAREAAEHIASFHAGKPVVVYRTAAGERGRFFYNEAIDGFNFSAAREPLGPVLDELLAGASDQAIYVGSTDLPIYFPGLDEANGAGLSDVHPSLSGSTRSIWLGNRTTATCHYDYSHNIAVCAVGQRRFTLFPPDQAANLYPGPLEPTPGGQVVSMVDFTAPDFDRFPRFRDALAKAQVAEMEAGDVLVYPAMWWHHVEALSPFNALVNYWWNAVPDYVDSPQVTLLHALLSLRGRPPGEKAAWRALFEFYVFGDAEAARAHLPEHAQGPLAPIDDGIARRLRAAVTRKLQR
jgi:cupin-like protein